MFLRKYHIPIIIFIFLYFCYILFSYKQFGITWDEQAVYERGQMLYQHLIDPNFPSDPKLLIKQTPDDVWPTYNNSYAMVLYALNPNQSYRTDHLLNLLFATLIFVGSYLFIYKKYKSVWLSLLAPLFMVLNPRFFGDIAANPKDMPFAVMYFLSVACFYFLSKNSNLLLRVLILGILLGLTQGLRPLGFTLYIVLFLYDLLLYFQIQFKNKTRLFFISFIPKEILYLFTIFIIANFFMLIIWPYVGGNFFKNMIDVFNVARQFPWTGTVFFMGKVYKAIDLPRYYLPVWLIIGMPFFVIVSSVGSLFMLKKKFLKNDVLFLCFTALVVNLLFYFLLKPVIYNGLRHFLFLLPLFSVLSAIFVIELFRSKLKIIKILFAIFLCIDILLIIVSQMRLFPYQYMYFNEIVGGFSGGAKNFETDYWAASALDAVRWLDKYTTAGKKVRNVYTCGLPLVFIQKFSPNMNWVSSASQANFAVCSTNENEYKKIPGKVIYTVGRESVPLSLVIQIK